MDDQNGHTFTYDDGYGNSGVFKTAADGKFISDEFSSVNRTHDIVRPDGSGGYTLEEEINGVLQLQQQVHAAGDSLVKFYDSKNTHLYNELNVTQGTDGKVTAAQVTLDPNVLAAGMSVGQIFGSALGGALGGNDLVGKLVGSAVGGLIGQKFVQVLATSMTADLSQVSLVDVFAGQGINIAGAGVGAVSSFLTAELGTALNIHGFGGTLFNIAGSSLTFSVLSQVVNSHLSIDAAIAAIDWSQAVSGAFNAAQLNVDGVLGGYLAHEFVPAKTHEGAVGGALLGAIGNLILPGGLGSFIGTVLGTLIFNHFGTSPSPGAVDLLDQAGNLYGYRQYQSSDHGTYDYPDKMAPAADAIINVYLHAVNGAALDHSKQVTIGYIVNPDLLFLSGVPGHTDRSFTNADDAVHAAALDVLQNTEVIGGDLLLKRAHHNSPSNDPQKAPGGGGLPGQPQFSAAEQLVTMAGDLSVAQDYETYLNNREAINALMAANPESAFTAGWIATFARVNDLHLNQYGPNDFLGGLVGYLDSVNKAGLGAIAANVSVKQYVNGGIGFEVRTANGAEVPGALSVFADRTDVTADATGQSVTFVFNNGLGPLGFYRLAATAPGGDGHNDFWIGGDGGATFNGTAGHDILLGGAAGDIIHGGAGWDFIDGGAGDDWIFGEGGSDILRGGRGTDLLFGGAGNDTYVFNRGDGVDTVLDEYKYMELDSAGGSGAPGSGGGSSHEVHADGGLDALVFGPGIAISDVAVRASGNGRDLIVGVKDPAHPGVPFEQLADSITLQNWQDSDGLDRIELLRFADGTTLNLAAALGTYLVPFGESLSRNTVAENSAIGTAVGTVTGFDLDASASLSYSLVGDTYGRFAINAATGVISVAGALNYEGTPTWPLVVRAADQYGHVFDKPFVINVTDVNEAPTDASLAFSGLAENSPGGTLAARVAGVDPDAGASLRYSLTDDAGGRFFIYPTTGEIVVVNSQLLDYEAASSHHITVRTTDQGGLWFDKSWDIPLTNVNEAPTDITLLGGSVPENSPGGTIVGTAHGIDPDAGTAFSYSLIGDVTGGRFAINASSGVISVAGALNYEGTSAWPIVVRAADQNGLVFDKAFVINVTNVNETPTDITLSGGSVPENSPGGTIIGTAHGVDQDVGTVFTYSLTDDAGGRFFIYPSTGIIVNYSSQSIDYETASSYHVTVRAADQSGLYVDKVLTLNLTNVNEAPTDITLSGSSVPENSPGGTVVGTAHGIDADVGTSFSYSLTDDAGGRFWINPTTGELVVVNRLLIDYEAASSHHITVRATDQGGMALDKGFTIAVTDVPERMHAVVSDFDGDGKSDILWYRDNGTVSIWDSGQVANAHWIADPGMVSANWHIRGDGDFDFNGRDDILWQNDNAAVSVWDNGTLAGAHIIAAAGVVAANSHIAGVGDFDGNHHDDVLWRNDNGMVWIWDDGQLGNAHTIAGAGLVPASWHIDGIGDFDGNGKDDILWHNDNGTISMWDDGQLAGAHWIVNPGVVANSWHVAGTGDFDGNGRLDILWRNDNGAVSIWDNGQIGGAHVVAAAGAIPDGWHIDGVGDFDGNGKDDVLWRNDNGTVSIWDNGQIGAAHWIADPGQVANSWHIA